MAHRKNFLAAILMSLAVLSRETATLVVAAGFLTWLSRKIHQESKKGIFFSTHFVLVASNSDFLSLASMALQELALSVIGQRNQFHAGTTVDGVAPCDR